MILLRRLRQITAFQSFCAHKLRIMSTWEEPKELKIPISYGHIAAKAWGKETNPPVLAMHGWQDNAGTFDRLIPLLTPNLYIVAIDAPGHGFSSHKPTGSFYHFMEMIIDVKRVVDYFNWTTFSIMGHSLGGTCALMYASLFPEAVSNLVLLDIAKPASRDPSAMPQESRKGVINLLEVDKKVLKPAPVYTMEDARDRLLEGLFNEIGRDVVDVLLKRGCKPSDCGKGVVFCRDIRVRMVEDLQKFSHEDLKAYMRRVTCNLLIVRGNASPIFQSRTPEVINDFLEIYKENCKSFELIQVEGNHFVHLNNPELVAPHVNSFFKTHLKFTSKM